MKVTVVTVLTVLIVLVVVMMVNMMLLMLIRVGSEAMIGYSPSVLATDPGTEEPIWYRSWYRGAANSPQRSPRCPQHIKILTILTQNQNIHNINPESKYSKPRNILFVDIAQYIIF